MTYTEMFAGQEDRTFEQRRDEVVALLSSATDLRGADRGLRSLVDRLGVAHDEREFDVAYDELVSSIGQSPLVA
jgi:hypothetical protein